MASLPADIETLIDSEKTLGVQSEWDDSDPRYLTLLIPITVGDLTVGGFDLRLKISKQFAARDGMGQLEYARAGRRSAEPLWRIDWKPLHTHDNDGAPADCAFETFEGSHEHRFADNYMRTEARMRRGNLPAARRLEPDPAILSEFLALCGQRFRIKDINRIRLPTITPDLFWTEDAQSP